MRKMWRKQKIAKVAEKAGWSRVFENKAIRAIYRHKNGKDFEPKVEDLPPKDLRILSKAYTMGDLLEAVKDNRLDRYWIEQFVKAGATRIDDGRLPRNTITIELLKSIPRKILLQLPPDILPWIRGYNCQNLLYRINKREATIKDLAQSNEVVKCFGPSTVTRNALLFKELGFTSRDCSFIRFAMLASHRQRLYERGMRLLELSEAQFT